jgi:hypothetical protein
LTSLTDIHLEDFSNNVGLSKYVFHGFPPASSAAALTALRDSQPTEVGEKPISANMSKAHASALRVSLGHTTEVAASLSGADGREAHATTVFYDGDPHAGGTAFDVERANYIAAGRSDMVKTLCRPTSCGVRRLYVVGKGTSGGASNHSWPIWIPCHSVSLSNRGGSAKAPKRLGDRQRVRQNV